MANKSKNAKNGKPAKIVKKAKLGATSTNI